MSTIQILNILPSFTIAVLLALHRQKIICLWGCESPIQHSLENFVSDAKMNTYWFLQWFTYVYARSSLFMERMMGRMEHMFSAPFKLGMGDNNMLFAGASLAFATYFVSAIYHESVITNENRLVQKKVTISTPFMPRRPITRSMTRNRLIDATSA